MISVQIQDFDVCEEYVALRCGSASGAVVTFIGLVRDMDDSAEVSSMSLEHYPGMTEKVLEELKAEAMQRWSLHDVRLIHRVGDLAPSDQIVFVGVSSTHRAAAFAACEFLIDYLKTRAPFWKKQVSGGTATWVQAREADDTRADRWQQIPKEAGSPGVKSAYG